MRQLCVYGRNKHVTFTIVRWGPGLEVRVVVRLHVGVVVKTMLRVWVGVMVGGTVKIDASMQT